MKIDITTYLSNTDWGNSKKTATTDKHPSEPKQANNSEITTKETTTNDSKPIKGNLYSIKELKENFHLSDEMINEEFEEFYHNIVWQPLYKNQNIAS